MSVIPLCLGQCVFCMCLGIVLTLNHSYLTTIWSSWANSRPTYIECQYKLLLQHLENNPHTQFLIRLITHSWQVTCLCSVVTPTSVTRVLSTPCAADLTGQYVRHLLEPAFCSVPTAAELPALFQSALRISGTLPFPVPDVFYESQRRQDGDMKHYLAPVSQSAAVKFSSKVHDVLTKSFPAGTEMVQAGMFLAYIFRICLLVFWGCGATSMASVCALPLVSNPLIWHVSTLLPNSCQELMLACRAL